MSQKPNAHKDTKGNQKTRYFTIMSYWSSARQITIHQRPTVKTVGEKNRDKPSIMGNCIALSTQAKTLLLFSQWLFVGFPGSPYGVVL